MKKITLIVPDRILHSLSTSLTSKTEEIGLSSENLLKVLCEDSSGSERFKFNWEDVRILSIEPAD